MSDEKDLRIKSINRMLLEMAKGNLHYRVARSEKKDHLESLSVTLNMLAEEMEEAMIHQGYANLDKNLLHIVQLSLITDMEGIVKGINSKSSKILNRKQDKILNRPFKNLLKPKSQMKWMEILEMLKSGEIQETKMDLDFKVKKSLAIPKTIYISKLYGLEIKDLRILISMVHHSRVDSELARELKRKVLLKLTEQELQSATTKNHKKVRLTHEDIKKIRKCHDFIMNNLAIDFPRLKDLALQFGTNEFKLKYGFKELYGTTVYRFILEERLREAQMLIRFSYQSLKTIANTVGFNSFPHFSRSFKKNFGYSPSDLRKSSLNRDK